MHKQKYTLKARKAILVCSPNQLCTSGFHCFLLLRCPRLSAAPQVLLTSASNWSGKMKAAVNFTVCLHFNKFYRGTVIHGVLQQQYGSLPVQFSKVRACSWVAPGETCAAPVWGREPPAQQQPLSPQPPGATPGPRARHCPRFVRTGFVNLAARSNNQYFVFNDAKLKLVWILYLLLFPIMQTLPCLFCRCLMLRLLYRLSGDV